MTTTSLAAPAVEDVLGAPGCQHTPPCPAADKPNHDEARVIFHDECAGYSLLCNGVICFCDTGELVGTTPVAPHRPGVPHCTNPDHTHCCDKET